MTESALLEAAMERSTTSSGVVRWRTDSKMSAAAALRKVSALKAALDPDEWLVVVVAAELWGIEMDRRLAPKGRPSAPRTVWQRFETRATRVREERVFDDPRLSAAWPKLSDEAKAWTLAKHAELERLQGPDWNLLSNRETASAYKATKQALMLAPVPARASPVSGWRFERLPGPFVVAAIRRGDSRPTEALPELKAGPKLLVGERVTATPLDEVLESWESAFGARIFYVGLGEWELEVARPPSGANDVRALAWQYFLFNAGPLLSQQPDKAAELLVQYLAGAPRWYLYFD